MQETIQKKIKHHKAKSKDWPKKRGTSVQLPLVTFCPVLNTKESAGGFPVIHLMTDPVTFTTRHGTPPTSTDTFSETFPNPVPSIDNKVPPSLLPAVGVIPAISLNIWTGGLLRNIISKNAMRAMKKVMNGICYQSKTNSLQDYYQHPRTIKKLPPQQTQFMFPNQKFFKSLFSNPDNTTAKERHKSNTTELATHTHTHTHTRARACTHV